MKATKMELESLLPVSELKPDDVYEVLESRNFVDKIFNSVLQDIKNSSAYRDLKDIALQHFASTEEEENEPIEKRKKQLCRVGYLYDSVASTLTKTLKEKLFVFQDDIYAASQAVIEELITSSNHELRSDPATTSLPKQKVSLVSYNSTSNLRNEKRKNESSSDTDASLTKKLSKRLKKPNSKYYSENILTSADYCFDDIANKF